MGAGHVVGRSSFKIDSAPLISGTARFTGDIPVKEPLHLAFAYSQAAHGEIKDIDLSAALQVPGVAAVFHHGNTPHTYFTTAGQGYPEPSPYDYTLFDHHVRFAGDRIAMVGAETQAAARRGAALVIAEIAPLPPLFDPELATAPGSVRLHQDGEHAVIPAAYRPEENVAAEVTISFGDIEGGFEDAAFIEEHTYHTPYASHCAIEPHIVAVEHQPDGRMVIISSTQVPFHVRRIVSRLLDIPLHYIRVIKPRIGGGFGAKQDAVLEPFAAFAALQTGRNIRMELSRREVFVSSRTRNPMRIALKTGVDANGKLTTVHMDALMNTGAYATHALTVLSNAGAKVLPLFNKVENLAFNGKAVYTTLPIGGAYRGYGATQGYFALNQQIDIICRRLGLDPVEYCKAWHIKEGESSAVFEALGEGRDGVSQIIQSCKLSECLDTGARAIGWQEKRGKRMTTEDGRVRGVGMAIAMQGSGIPEIDMGSASMKMNEDGSAQLFVGATDIGTGSDTILVQIAAETLLMPPEKIYILSSDTDLTPFDVGAYASSTTYISGGAVQKCAQKILDRLARVAARMLDCSPEDLLHEPESFRLPGGERKVTFEEILYHATYTAEQCQIQAGASHTSRESPPPFAAQFAEVEVDPETGVVRVLRFVSAVDCGRAINPALAEGQVEGAALNGISFALTEQYRFSESGRMVNPSFGRYGLPTAPDVPEMQTILVDSYEPSGPFGAKSVGEIGINGAAPAIANAICDAVGVRLFDLPFTPEAVYRAIHGADSL